LYLQDSHRHLRNLRKCSQPCIMGFRTPPPPHPAKAVIQSSRSGRNPAASSRLNIRGRTPCSRYVNSSAQYDRKFGNIFLSPWASYPYTAGTFIAERLLYQPSIGFCALAALAAHRLHAAAAAAGCRRAATAVLVVAAAAVAAGSAATAMRNRVWKDTTSVVRAAAAVCPGSAKLAQVSLSPFLPLFFANSPHTIRLLPFGRTLRTDTNADAQVQRVTISQKLPPSDDGDGR
jgi:hypothetical protein